MASWGYEGLLLLGVVFIAGYLFSTLTQTRHALDNRLGQQLFLFLVLGVYFVWFWSKGQTLAMKTWHIEVVDAQGRPLGTWRAAVRYLCSWMWFAPPLAGVALWPGPVPPTAALSLMAAWVAVWAAGALWRDDRQFVHDAWAGTRLQWKR
ncbi:MAG: RDD family protein [Rhodoferax sp.]